MSHVLRLEPLWECRRCQVHGTQQQKSATEFHDGPHQSDNAPNFIRGSNKLSLLFSETSRRNMVGTQA